MFNQGKWLATAWQRSNSLHSTFLASREAGLLQLSTLIRIQLGMAGVAKPVAQPARPAAIFSRADLEELATGSIARVFGPEFQVYETRRTPRIPNSDLLFMSRVVAIQGERGCLNSPASIDTEYDVPGTAWFFSSSSQHVLPAFACMEAALQPCGLLSAYLGTMQVNPQEDYYFRNLDGQAEILAHPQMSGKVLAAHADLLSTTFSAGMIIQKFSFSLSCQGQAFYRGESTFGFFPPERMANQTGLDGGKTIRPELEQAAPSAGSSTVITLEMGRAENQDSKMDFIHSVRWRRDGGKYGKGIISASKHISPDDWFYRCHFYQDAVMPGSLGVEAVLQALEVYARHSSLLEDGAVAVCTPAVSQPFTWKYRGQFSPANKILMLEIHISRVESSVDGVLVCGDASVWADGMRIYEVRDAAVRLYSV